MTKTRLALFALILVFLNVSSGSFIIGFLFSQFNIFPAAHLHQTVHEIVNFVKGHEEKEAVDFFAKLENDLGIKPSRNIQPRDYEIQYDLIYKPLEIRNLSEARHKPKVYVDGNGTGAYIISGAFNFVDEVNSFIAIDAKSGAFLHRWIEPEDLKNYLDKRALDLGIEYNFVSNHLRGAPWFASFSDGSIIYATGFALVKLDRCSSLEWAIPGSFHHSVEPTEDNIGVWVLDGPHIRRINVKTGEEERSISFFEIVEANKHLHIFDIRRNVFTKQNLQDPFHENEVAPFPHSKASYFSDWNLTEDDVMVSFRSLNLLFVLDTRTLQIKWWRFGLAKRQHDPDWQDGFVTVFNNNTRDTAPYSSGFSEIKRFSLEEQFSEVLYSGNKHEHYTKHEGAHQLVDDDILISSSTQGRVSRVDPDGNLVFDFLNLWDEDEILTITQAIHLPNLQTGKDCLK